MSPVTVNEDNNKVVLSQDEYWIKANLMKQDELPTEKLHPKKPVLRFLYRKTSRPSRNIQNIVPFGNVRKYIVPNRRVRTLIPSNRSKPTPKINKKKTLNILSTPDRLRHMSMGTYKSINVRPIVGKLAERKRNSRKWDKSDHKNELRFITRSSRPKFGIGYMCPNCNARINIRNKAQIEIVMISHINYCLTVTHAALFNPGDD